MNPATTTKPGLPPSIRLERKVFGRILLLFVLLGQVFFCLESTAATVFITAQNFSFSPSAVSIGLGDSVVFNNAGGDHNVTGYNPAPPPERFCGTTVVGPGPMCMVTFTNTGVFQFRCVPHSSGSGTNFSGMIGSVTVTSPPIAVVVPRESFVLVGDSVTLGLTNAPAFASTYQWQFNGTNINGAVTATLALTSLTTNDSGSYRVSISNAFQVVTTAVATVQVIDRLTIVRHPRNTNAPAGSNVTLSATALGPFPLTYQWQRNSTNLPGATNPSLSLTNVQFDPHTGDYRVLASDTASNVVWSETATLLVLTRPVITNQPIALTVLQGGTAIFTVVAGPNHPLNPLAYRWIRGGTPVVTSSVPTLVLTNVQSNTTIRVAVTNLSTGLGGLNSSTVNLTVLPDADRDGMADTWEMLYGFSTNNAADALLDFDFDGMINRDEYAAGTDPTNADSVLKLQLASQTGGQRVLTFLAISNRTYSVEWNTEASADTWNRLQNVLAQPSDRIESVIDTNAGGMTRFYRVVTPERP